MPARIPVISTLAAQRLVDLGARIRAHRKTLGISATVTAEAAGISRMTLHRIEEGKHSVTIGAWVAVMDALGLQLGIGEPEASGQQDAGGSIPVRIRLADYPQLARLAWHVQGRDELAPGEALDIYERHWRHIDEQALEPHERQLVEALRRGLA